MGAIFDALYTFWNQIVYAISNIRFFDIIDIIAIAWIIYKAIGFLLETRAGMLVKGLSVIFGTYLLANLFKLTVVSWLLSVIVDSALVVMAIIFQPEIRRMLEKVGHTKLIGSKKYDDESDWEILDRLDLGNDEDFVYIQKMISDNFTTDVNFYWSDAVRDGAEMWKMREDGLADLPEDLKNWIKYERVRMSGKYNMVTEAGYASYEANLSMEDYREVQKNYTDLAMKAIEKIGREKIKELVEK